MKRLYTFIFFAFIFIVSSNAQTGTLVGKVTGLDKNPITGATIKVQKTTFGTSTKANGEYTLSNIPPATYTVIVTTVGAQPEKREITIKAGINELDFVLNRTAMELNEININENKKFAARESKYVSKLPITNLENPQVYSVIPKELLAQQVVTDYRSALQNAPGVNNVAAGFGGGGYGLNITMRGFSGAAGDLRNGMNTNGLTIVDPVNIESIEVIKGPSATLYGSIVSYGGLINRVTKKPFDYFKGEVGYTFGDWNLSRTTVDINTPLNADKTLLLRVNGAVDEQKTWQDVGRNSTISFAPAITYKVSPKLTLDLEMEYFDGKINTTFYDLLPHYKDYNWDFKKAYTSNDLRGDQKVSNIFGKATYILSPNWTSETFFSTALTSSKAKYLFVMMNEGTEEDPALRDSLTRSINLITSTSNTTQIQQNFTGKINFGTIKSRVLIGADYNAYSSDDLRFYSLYDNVRINGDTETGTIPALNYQRYLSSIAGAEPDYEGIYNSWTAAAYVSTITNLTDNLLVMASLRYSRFNVPADDLKQGAFSPKLGIVYQVVPRSVSLFANYMNGYINNYPGVTRESAPNLVNFKPEYANQLEGGVKFELLGGKLNGTVSYYNILVDNMLRNDPTDFNFSIQDGSRRSSGVEFDVIANPVPGLSLTLGYGYNNSKYLKAFDEEINDKRPFATPENVANGWVSYHLQNGKLKGLGLGFGGNYQSNSYYDDMNTILIDGATTFDGSVFFVHQKFRIGFKLNNITNEKYFTIPRMASPMPLRQFLANFTLKF